MQATEARCLFYRLDERFKQPNIEFSARPESEQTAAVHRNIGLSDWQSSGVALQRFVMMRLLLMTA
jgi:hypothetical protein